MKRPFYGGRGCKRALCCYGSFARGNAALTLAPDEKLRRYVGLLQADLFGANVVKTVTNRLVYTA